MAVEAQVVNRFLALVEKLQKFGEIQWQIIIIP